MSMVRQAIIEELRELIPKSQEFSYRIETAKTNVKRDLYKKKLKKNNQKVADLIIALEKLEKEERNDTNNHTQG